MRLITVLRVVFSRDAHASDTAAVYFGSSTSRRADRDR